jgi:hypothetical protein
MVRSKVAAPLYTTVMMLTKGRWAVPEQCSPLSLRPPRCCVMVVFAI